MGAKSVAVRGANPEPSIFAAGTKTNIKEGIVDADYHRRARTCLASFFLHAGCEAKLKERHSTDGAGSGTDEGAHGVSQDGNAS